MLFIIYMEISIGNAALVSGLYCMTICELSIKYHGPRIVMQGTGMINGSMLNVYYEFARKCDTL